LYTLVKINYISNIKIKKPLFQKTTAKSKILFNRRFIVFLHLFQYLFEDNYIDHSIIYKPTKFRKFNVLRAPYKNKRAQNAYCFYKYKFAVYFKIANKVYRSNNVYVLLLKLFRLGAFSTNISIVSSIVFFKYYKLKI
jgi:hypothetical protein